MAKFVEFSQVELEHPVCLFHVNVEQVVFVQRDPKQPRQTIIQTQGDLFTVTEEYHDVMTKLRG